MGEAQHFLDGLADIYQRLDLVLEGDDLGLSGENFCGDCILCCYHNYRFPVGSLELAFMESQGHVITDHYLDFVNGRIKSPNGALPLCPHSSPEGCIIYGARPMCCRLYGFSPHREPMPGCVYIPLGKQTRKRWSMLQPLFHEFLRLREAHCVEMTSPPRTLTDFLGLGRHHLLAGDFHRALGLIHNALALNPKDPRAHFTLGEYHDQRQEGDKALIHFLDSLELDPTDYNTHVRLGRIYGNKNDWSRALDHYVRARELDPHSPLHWMLAGSAHFALEQQAEARSHMEKALALNPDPDLSRLCQNYLDLCPDSP
ncbi:MAG: tetratricopeptide repeat protein [Desulfobacterales bacterium]|nr:tetratricopeptide repeat protein [Desulfobacterales bacterium]